MKANDKVEAVLKSIGTAEAHIRSEYVRNLEGTMATVGPHPHYAVTAAPAVISVISGRDSVAGFYESAHQFAVPQASRFLTQIASDWYMFVENMPTRTWVADGSLRTAHTATLLVNGTVGITGEFVWERPPETASPSAVASLPMGSLRSVSLHEAYLAAVCEGDASAIGALLDANCTWAERDYLREADGGAILELHGPGATASWLTRWHERFKPERVSVMNRQATDWYVFAEELWIGQSQAGERCQYRKAAIYPVTPTGELHGAIGFGTDLEQATSLADFSFGQAFWPEAESERQHRPMQSRTLSASPF